MRFQLKLTSIVVPRGTGQVVIGFDMGQPGCYGEIHLTPEQAQQFASDITGAAFAASRNVDGPVLVTPDQLPEFCRVCL